MTPKNPLAAASLVLALASLPLAGMAQFAFDVSGTEGAKTLNSNSPNTAGAGVGLQVGPQFYMNVYYNADFGRNDDENHTVSVSANIRF